MGWGLGLLNQVHGSVRVSFAAFPYAQPNGIKGEVTMVCSNRIAQSGLRSHCMKPGWSEEQQTLFLHGHEQHILLATSKDKEDANVMSVEQL